MKLKDALELCSPKKTPEQYREYDAWWHRERRKQMNANMQVRKYTKTSDYWKS